MRSDGPTTGQPAETRAAAQNFEAREDVRDSGSGTTTSTRVENRTTAPRGSSFFRRRNPVNLLRLTGWRRFAGVLVPLALAGTALFTSPTASAVPNPSVADVKKKVQKLKSEADTAAEDYVETREKLKSTQVKLKAAKKNVGKQEDRVKVLKKQVGLLAAESYKKGELSTLSVLLSDDPEAALAKAGYLPTLSARQSGALNDLADAQQALVDTQKSMEKQIQVIKASNVKMKKAQETADKKLAAAEAELSTLQASERAEAEADPSGGSVPVGSGGGGGDCASGMAAAPSAAAKQAISFACNQRGLPYVWAAAGPSSYDCSGLTMKAYASAGVSLPHSSRMQAGYGTSVSNANLMAGDLVFFGSPINHVGIYLGNNMMVHAPRTGDVVKVASLWTTPVAAARLG
ncbi:C40 family peptidase [Kineosporia succinea]|uniref:Cell wall-associated NlpC family hydrolase n=1 Tax=Kineosporia succinea TaxID=84632 RepID=A0ABT9P6D0_9ACTN|nr:C40 family peptidase [Kineosporia succinea]MDP9828237.1 cell wall-associated NlpC family hydrolase [Kineosporia succinea]